MAESALVLTSTIQSRDQKWPFQPCNGANSLSSNQFLSKMPMIWPVRQKYSRCKFTELVCTIHLTFLRTIQSTPEISTMAFSSAGLLVADIHGSIHVLDENFESERSWVAHVGGRVTHMVEKSGLLITFGVHICL
jgi:hypothetical protein